VIGDARAMLDRIDAGEAELEAALLGEGRGPWFTDLLPLERRSLLPRCRR
jgi:hypothetical protein